MLVQELTDPTARRREQRLKDTVKRNHDVPGWAAVNDFADLHVMIQPTTAVGVRPFDRDGGTTKPDQMLATLTKTTVDVWEGPFFGRHLKEWSSMQHYHDWSRYPTSPHGPGWSLGSQHSESNHGMVVDLTVTDRGGGYLFCGRAGTFKGKDQDTFVLIDDLVVGLTVHTLAIMGGIYAQAQYAGSVDVGLAVTGMDGKKVFSEKLDQQGWYFGCHVEEPATPRSGEYSQTALVSSPSDMIDDPITITHTLVGDLIEQVTVGNYDPFCKIARMR